VLAEEPTRRADQLQNWLAIRIGGGVSGIELHDALFNGAVTNAQGQLERSRTLAGGDDGGAPTEAEYRLALGAIAALEDVSIVAAPGSSAYGADTARAVMGTLIAHAEARRAYRIAVLDTPPGQIPGDVRTLRGTVDSRYAALYYPWVVVANPNARPGREDIPREIALPPSGYVCGIYARNDVQRGVHKAPANEVVRSALRFEVDVNFGQQELLNPLGVNCLRTLPVFGSVVWGARTLRGADAAADEYKYVPVRRTALFIEESLYRGLKWVVFEPNDEPLWAQIRLNVGAFMHNLFRQGAFQGRTPRAAYLVKCDAETTTQNDINLGIVNILVGFAPLKPAEFVIIRLQQLAGQIQA
jgi:phage tail sheath protein FI